MAKIKAIIFDVCGVLALDKRKDAAKYNRRVLGVHEYVAKKLKISLDQYFDSIDTDYTKSMAGEISEEKVVKEIAANFKITPKKLKKLYLGAYESHFKQNEQLFKELSKLEKQGYILAVLSDQWHLSEDPLMPKKLYKRFGVLIVSCDVGLRKPDPKIYKLVLKKLKLKPSQTVFVDNQEWNLKPARKLGMKAIQFKNNKQLFQDLKELGIE
ncbi:HAD family phosphatase [Candidatus Pacearchaeota archaeon]|nr:HAD family phosphatase [Candidatus Pacearchaeota archaeon]